VRLARANQRTREKPSKVRREGKKGEEAGKARTTRLQEPRPPLGRSRPQHRLGPSFPPEDRGSGGVTITPRLQAKT
jgi:hypothetical protein